MSLKKWIWIFIISALICTSVFVCGNVIIDPFGVFGDPLLDFYSYNMTQNPRVSKIAYLDQHFEAYDSYLIGSSKTSSFPESTLSQYWDGAKFYNMLMYGGDLYDVEKTAEYIAENYAPKNFIINMGLEELVFYDVEEDPVKGNLHTKVLGEDSLQFYLKYLFLNPTYGIHKWKAYNEKGYIPTNDCVFSPETGAYDKALRDIEFIGTMDSYLTAHPDFLAKQHSYNKLPFVEECLSSIRRIKALCEENDINLTIIISPLYHTELTMYYGPDVLYFLGELAEITPFWDFSGYTSVSLEPRYFYDYAHFRNAVGNMMLAKMFSDDRIYVPDDFGFYVTAQTVEDRIKAYGSPPRSVPHTEMNSTQLPVLLYHHLVAADEPMNDITMSVDAFEQQIAALSEAGYTGITIEDMISYVQKGSSLPAKPILITFDDGYQSNLALAAPILRKYQMQAEIFVIGVSVGKDTYKDTNTPITPHFDWTEFAMAQDVFTIQSHSYDMHRVASLDLEHYRNGVSMLPDEDEDTYIAMFEADIKTSCQEIGEGTGKYPVAFSYPQGIYHSLSEVLLSQLGIQATFTTEPGVNTLVRGLPQSLFALKRITPYETMDITQLLMQLEGK